MKDTVWICFNKKGATRMVKRTRTRPSLGEGEFAVLMAINVPETVFADNTAEATLNVARARVIKPQVATVEAQ